MQGTVVVCAWNNLFFLEMAGNKFPGEEFKT